MKGFGKAIGLTILLIWFLSAKTYPSTTQTYVSRGSSLVRLSSPKLSLLQGKYSNLLFAQQMKDLVRADSLDSMHGERSRPIRLKDPKMAVFYAVIPGIVIHGSGHFYAGRLKTGFLLLGTEVVGVSLLFGAALASFAEAMGGENGLDAELWGMGGFVLFVGSWVYDVVGSPIAVKKQNEELLQRRQGKLKFQIEDENPKFVIIYSF